MKNIAYPGCIYDVIKKLSILNKYFAFVFL